MVVDGGTPIANDHVKYATYTRDPATSLDYADQRYYSNQFRRFMTADRYHSSSGPKHPQSRNRLAIRTATRPGSLFRPFKPLPLLSLPAPSL